jgi:hypothetical protein
MPSNQKVQQEAYDPSGELRHCSAISFVDENGVRFCYLHHMLQEITYIVAAQTLMKQFVSQQF